MMRKIIIIFLTVQCSCAWGQMSFKELLSNQSSTTVYVGNVYEETDGRSRTTIYNGNTPIVVNEMGNRSYYESDHLGGTNVVTDSKGVLKELIEYEPYGQVSKRKGTVTPNERTYTGQKSDDETGLMYYNARYYNPQLGRFISADTIIQAPGNPQTLNRYAYAGNNPINAIDPDGHSFWKSVKKFFEKWGDFVNPLARGIITEDWQNYGWQLLNQVTMAIGPNPLLQVSARLSYLSRASSHIGDEVGDQVSQGLSYAAIAAGAAGTTMEINKTIEQWQAANQATPITKQGQTAQSAMSVDQGGRTAATQLSSPSNGFGLSNDPGFYTYKNGVPIFDVSEGDHLSMETMKSITAGYSKTVMKEGINLTSKVQSTIKSFSDLDFKGPIFKDYGNQWAGYIKIYQAEKTYEKAATAYDQLKNIKNTLDTHSLMLMQ